MNKIIQRLGFLSLLLLIGFMTACNKENIENEIPLEDPDFPIDTLFCDLSFDLELGMGGIPLETVTVTNLTGGTAPYYYIWNTGDSTETIVAPVAGIYSVTVTDGVNCSHADSIEVTLNMSPCDPDSFNLSIVALDTFPIGTKRLEPQVSGTAPPYTYEWSTGETTMYTAVTMKDTYSLTVTDTDSCTAVSSIFVCPSFIPEINPIDTMGMTLLFVIDSTGTAPFTYLWQDGSTNNPLEATSPGTYSVTVVDADSCIGMASYNF